jgi:hypothetical protein
MQEALPEPFLHVSSDHLMASGMLPARRDPDGPFAWWQQMRPRFLDGFHRCLPALAAAGNDFIVEHIIEFRAWREYRPGEVMLCCERRRARGCATNAGRYGEVTGVPRNRDLRPGAGAC